MHKKKKKRGTYLCIVIICKGYVVKGNYYWVSNSVNIISMGNQNFAIKISLWIALF